MLNFQYSSLLSQRGCLFQVHIQSTEIQAFHFKFILQLCRSSCSCKVSPSSWTSWLLGSQTIDLSLTEGYRFPNTLYCILACWCCFGLLRISVLQRSCYGSSLNWLQFIQALMLLVTCHIGKSGTQKLRKWRWSESHQSAAGSSAK